MPIDPAPSTPDPDPMPQPPEWPGDDACCGNGCDPCVFDLHAAAQARYRDALAAWRARHPDAAAGPA
jgi:Oxidoreductase-like protein, N-terminal